MALQIFYWHKMLDTYSSSACTTASLVVHKRSWENLCHGKTWYICQLYPI